MTLDCVLPLATEMRSLMFFFLCLFVSFCFLLLSKLLEIWSVWSMHTLLWGVMNRPTPVVPPINNTRKGNSQVRRLTTEGETREIGKRGGLLRRKAPIGEIRWLTASQSLNRSLLTLQRIGSSRRGLPDDDILSRSVARVPSQRRR